MKFVLVQSQEDIKLKTLHILEQLMNIGRLEIHYHDAGEHAFISVIEEGKRYAQVEYPYRRNVNMDAVGKWEHLAAVEMPILKRDWKAFVIKDFFANHGWSILEKELEYALNFKGEHNDLDDRLRWLRDWMEQRFSVVQNYLKLRDNCWADVYKTVINYHDGTGLIMNPENNEKRYYFRFSADHNFGDYKYKLSIYKDEEFTDLVHETERYSDYGVTRNKAMQRFVLDLSEGKYYFTEDAFLPVEEVVEE